MSNRFFENMTRDIGDADPVWRYLTEKVGHVALLTLVLVSVTELPAVGSSVVAATAYDLVGKALWFNGRQVDNKIGELKDTLYDLWVTLLVTLIVAIPEVHLWVVPGFFLWSAGIILGSLYQWGSPS